jgi:hypothetical protein
LSKFYTNFNAVCTISLCKTYRYRSLVNKLTCTVTTVSLGGGGGGGGGGVTGVVCSFEHAIARINKVNNMNSALLMLGFG